MGREPGSAPALSYSPGAPPGRPQVARPNSDVIRVESSITAISSSEGRSSKRLAASRTRGSRARSPAVFRKTPGREDPVHRAVDVRLLLERLVPCRVRPGGRGPGAAGDGLDDLNRDVPLPADAQHLLEVSPVELLLGHEEVVGQQHGVEVEACEAPPVHGGDGPAVTGHADEAREPLLTSLDQRLERAGGPPWPDPSRRGGRGGGAGSGGWGRRGGARARGG